MKPKENSFVAVAFCTFFLMLLWLSMFLVLQAKNAVGMGINQHYISTQVAILLPVLALLIWMLGAFFDNKYFYLTQIIIALSLTYFIHILFQNALISLAVGMISFGILTFGSNALNAGYSYLFLLSKWLLTSILVPFFAFIADKYLAHYLSEYLR